jgi:cytochrome c-type biogenesis protein CcmF
MVGRNRRRYGGYIVHLAIVVLFVGLAGSRGFSTEADVAIRKGERAQVAGYTLVNEGATSSKNAHRSLTSVRVGVYRGGDRVGTMNPGMKQFTVDQTRASDVAIKSGPARDLYLVLTQLDTRGVARISVFVNPLVGWIWFSGVLIVAGGLLAAWPSRSAVRREPVASPASDGRAAA